MLSDHVAATMVTRRKALKLTRDDLAAECARVGLPALTLAAIESIETGRPGANGQRRRHVTVDELIALARALRIPPLDLLLPLDNELAEILPGQKVPTWAAATWVTGENPWPVPTEQDTADWNNSASGFFRKEDSIINDCLQAAQAVGKAKLVMPTTSGKNRAGNEEWLKDKEEKQSAHEDRLKMIRKEIQAAGIKLRQLPPELEHLDTGGSQKNFSNEAALAQIVSHDEPPEGIFSESRRP